MRPETTELQIECLYCHHFTKSINPIVIKKIKGNRYQISATCIICKRAKGKTLNKAQVKELPEEIKNSPDGSVFANDIQQKGGMIPLNLLLPLITAGISALPDIGKTIYNAIKGNGVGNETGGLIGNETGGLISNEELIELVCKIIQSGDINLKEICEKIDVDYYD